MAKFYLRDDTESSQRCYLKPTYGISENKQSVLELITETKYYPVLPLITSSVGYDTYTDNLGGEYYGWITGTEDVLPQGNYFLGCSQVKLVWEGTGNPGDKANVCMYAKAYQVHPVTEEYTLIASANSGIYELAFGVSQSKTFGIPFTTNFEITNPEGAKLFISYNLYLVTTNLDLVKFLFICETAGQFIDYIEGAVTTRTVQNTINLQNAITKVLVLDTRTVSNNLDLSPQFSGIMTNNRLVEVGFNLAPAISGGGGGRSIASTLNLAGEITRVALSHPDRTVNNTLNLSPTLSRITGSQRIVENDLVLSSTIEKGDSDIRDGKWEDALTDVEDGFEEAL